MLASILLIATCLLIPSEGKIKEMKMVTVKDYHGCPLDLPFKQDEVKISVLGRGKVGFTGYINITEDIGNITLISIRLDRCKSAADVESCEYFTSGKYHNPCPMLSAGNQMWSESFKNVEPKFKCPMKKGQYRLNNCTLDPSAFASFPGIDGWYWKLKTKIYKDDWLVSCFKAGIQVETIRRRT